MTGIICALKIEVDGLKEVMTNTEKRTVAGLDFFKGEINSREVYMIGIDSNYHYEGYNAYKAEKL